MAGAVGGVGAEPLVVLFAGVSTFFLAMPAILRQYGLSGLPVLASILVGTIQPQASALPLQAGSSRPLHGDGAAAFFSTGFAATGDAGAIVAAGLAAAGAAGAAAGTAGFTTGLS